MWIFTAANMRGAAAGGWGLPGPAVRERNEPGGEITDLAELAFSGDDAAFRALLLRRQECLIQNGWGPHEAYGWASSVCNLLGMDG